MSEELKSVYRQLMENIANANDVDVAQLFREDRQPLKSPGDKDRRRTERIELEELFITVRVFFVLLLFRHMQYVNFVTRQCRRRRYVFRLSRSLSITCI